jgi:hypothetical protein
MPKTNIDYSKTIIYKLINYDYPELVYVGSTTNFTKRKQQHKDAVFNTNSQKYGRKLYVSIRASGYWESWVMIKICDYPCNSKREAETEEDRHMIELKSNLNIRRASRTKEQYYEDNKDKIKDKNKQYQDDNKDKIKDKKKQYFEENKGQIKENKSKKCTCECGAIIQHCVKARHLKTIKHQKYLNTIE